MSIALDVLKRYWGHQSFRTCQEQIITSCIEGEDTIALLPTGGGKSVCFQIPGIVKEGICLVISPLIALMEDQVTQLKARGIKAVALDNSIKPVDLPTFFDNCKFGSYRFLYISPERLQNELVLELVQQLPLNLIAVDEAHCISEWGHDFRPDYRKIKVLRELKPAIPIIALTATATLKVIDDIKDNLDLFQPKIYKTSFYRKNLAYQVYQVEDKLAAVLRVFKKYPGSSIIYVRNRKASYEIASWLQENQISSTYYHGGIDSSEKSERLQQWMSDKTPVIVATNAFGMGIDKANVCNVIHLALPDSIENYFQEAGRAGRNGEKVNAFLFYNQNDIRTVKNQFLKSLPDQTSIKKVYSRLVTYFQIPYGEGELQVHQFNFNSFCQRYDLPLTLTYNCIRFLDQSGILTFIKRFRRSSTLHIKSTGSEILAYIEKNKDYKLVIKAILRFYGGVFEEPTAVNVAAIARKIEKSESFIINVLQQIEATNMLSFQHKITDAEITWLVPREDDHTIIPLHTLLKKYREAKTSKVKKMIAYVENRNICRSIQLLQYFDQKTGHMCGICDVCLSNLPIIRDEEMALEIKRILTNSDLTFEELVLKINATDTQILKVLRVLIEKRVVAKNDKNKYQIVNT